MVVGVCTNMRRQKTQCMACLAVLPLDPRLWVGLCSIATFLLVTHSDGNSTKTAKLPKLGGLHALLLKIGMSLLINAPLGRN